MSIQGNMERVWQAIRLFFSWIVARETIWSVGASPAAAVLQTVPLQAAQNCRQLFGRALSSSRKIVRILAVFDMLSYQYVLFFRYFS